MKIRICDLCKKNYPNAKIKYKYRAVQERFWFCGVNWEKIELCQECLDKIIKAESEGSNENKIS